MKNLSRSLVAVFIFTIFNVNTASANSKIESSEKEKIFSVRLSADNHLRHSQEAWTDVFLSIGNAYAYATDKYQLHDNIGARIANIALVYHLMVINHEFGHAMRVKEFGYQLKGITVGFGSGRVSYNYPRSDLLSGSLKYQKDAVISLGGVQADYFLSQKIINQSLNRNQAMDPISSTLYFGTALDQVMYSYSKYKGNGHDIKSYINNMERMYGKGSITKSKIQAVAWIDFLDPLAYTSAYSFLLNEDMELPMLPIGNWPGLGDVEVMPAAKLVLTPYGVLEKRLVLYARTDYSPIKLVFGFGRENKTNTPVVRDRNSSYYSDGFTTPDSVAPKKHNTYYFELAVNKALSYESLNLGFALAAWRQPKLLINDPRHAKIKNGGMVTLKAEHQMSESNSVFADVGYKTQGFVMGQPLAKAPFVRVGFNWNL